MGIIDVSIWMHTWSSINEVAYTMVCDPPYPPDFLYAEVVIQEEAPSALRMRKTSCLCICWLWTSK